MSKKKPTNNQTIGEIETEEGEARRQSLSPAKLRILERKAAKIEEKEGKEAARKFLHENGIAEEASLDMDELEDEDFGVITDEEAEAYDEDAGQEDEEEE